MSLLSKFKQTSVWWEIVRTLTPIRDVAARRVERRFYRSIVPSGPGTIVDVGANIGWKTEIFRGLAERVVAIEPAHFAAHTLRTRFKWRPDVVVLECAISQSPGTVTFYEFAPASAYNSADPNWASLVKDNSNTQLPRPKEVQVQARTIDQIEIQYRPIKYLKLDVEGHELPALSTLTSAIPLVSLEFALPQNHQALVGCIRQLEMIHPYEFNVAIAEPPQRMAFNEWLDGTAIVQAIRSAGWKYVELYARTL